MTATTPAENPESEEETIKLDQFLKLADIVGSGGEAKHLIRSGAIRVNGELRNGDVVTYADEDYVIETTPS
jgi:ribosome-associated protein